MHVDRVTVKKALRAPKCTKTSILCNNTVTTKPGGGGMLAAGLVKNFNRFMGCKILYNMAEIISSRVVNSVVLSTLVAYEQIADDAGWMR